MLFRKNAVYRDRDKQLERKFAGTNTMTFLNSKCKVHDLIYYYLDKDTIRISLEYNEAALFVAYKRAKENFAEACGYSTFSEFFEKEGYNDGFNVGESYNMDNYIIGHICPDNPYKVTFDRDVHIRINGTKRHPPVETTVRLTEAEICDDLSIEEPVIGSLGWTYNGKGKSFTDIDETTQKGNFECIETAMEYSNIFAALYNYINVHDYTPINKMSPDYLGSQRHTLFCFVNLNNRHLIFSKDDGKVSYILKYSDSKTVKFAPAEEEFSVLELNHRKIMILLDALLKQQPCKLDSDFLYSFRRQWDDEKKEKNKVGVDFAFDKIETPEGGSIRIERLPSIEDLASGKAFEKIRKEQEQYSLN